jgi:hypothetical protein
MTASKRTRLTLCSQLSAVLSILGASSPRAEAAATSQGNWVLNGATIDYGGAANVLRVGYGTAVINGPDTEFPGLTTEVPTGGGEVTVNLATSNGITYAVTGTGCASSSALSASTAYYVYYENNYIGGLPDGAPNGLIFTTVQPTETGVPDTGGSKLAWAIPNVFCNDGAPASDLVFLGSFLTDANADIIPFFRNGENILFTQPLGYVGGYSCSASKAFTSATVPTSITLPLCSNIPKSASELLLDVTVANGDTDPHHVIIVSGNLGTFANCTGPTGVIGEFFAPPSANTGAFQLDYETNVSLSSNLLLGICDGAWGTGTVTAVVTQRGYVESVHHLNQER